MSSMRKRNFEDALDSSQGQEDEGRTCKATKVDAEDSELPQDEHNPAIKPTDPYLDVNHWASTCANETPPLPHLFNFVADTASLSSQYSAPLTEENLFALDETMPLKKDTSSGATTESSTENVSRAFQILKLNNVFVDSKDAEERGKELIQEAKKIVRGPRLSAINDAQAETIREAASELSLDDELTFMVGVWKLVIHTHRTVELKNKEDEIVFVETAWDKDNLKCNWGSPFAANIAPQLRFANPDMEALAGELPKLKNVKPDLTYGYNESAFTSEQMAINENVKGELCRRNWHAFLIGEAKSIDLPFQLGVAQVARGAITAIYLKRKLKEDAKPSVIAGSSTCGGVPGLNLGQKHYKADRSSFIFTFVVSPERARLYVAWAEEEWEGNNKEPGINYHMTSLSSYYFDEGGEHWAALHHDLDNVLDWGVGPCKTEVLRLLDDIANKKKDGNKRVGP